MKQIPFRLSFFLVGTQTQLVNEHSKSLKNEEQAFSTLYMVSALLQSAKCEQKKVVFALIKFSFLMILMK